MMNHRQAKLIQHQKNNNSMTQKRLIETSFSRAFTNFRLYKHSKNSRTNRKLIPYTVPLFIGRANRMNAWPSDPGEWTMLPRVLCTFNWNDSVFVSRFSERRLSGLSHSWYQWKRDGVYCADSWEVNWLLWYLVNHFH